MQGFRILRVHVLLFLLCVVVGELKSQAFFPQYTEKSNAWFFVDKNGKQVVQIKEQNVGNVGVLINNRALALDASTQKWGYLDEKGKWAIKPQYSRATNFSYAYAIVYEEFDLEMNDGLEGLLFGEKSKAIDVNGKVVLEDRCLEERPYYRWNLIKHLYDGVFLVNLGYGFGDTKSLVNIKGELLLLDPFYEFGESEFSATSYSTDVKAYKCGRNYYNSNGDVVIKADERDIDFGLYVNGYAWVDKVVGEEEAMIKSLVDTRRVEVFRMSDDVCSNPSRVVKGKFICANEEGQYFEYDVKTKAKKQVIMPAVDYDDWVYYHPELDLDLLIGIGGNDGIEVKGFLSPKKEWVYKIREE